MQKKDIILYDLSIDFLNIVLNVAFLLSKYGFLTAKARLSAFLSALSSACVALLSGLPSPPFRQTDKL